MQAAGRSHQVPPAASGAADADPAADAASAQLWEAARALNLLDDQVSTLHLTRHHSTLFLPGALTLDTLRSHHQPCLEELAGGLATNPSSLAWQHSLQTPWWSNEPNSEPPGGTMRQHGLGTLRGPAKQLPDSLDGSHAAGGLHLAADGRAGQHAAGRQAAHAALLRAGSGAGSGPALSTGRQAARAVVEPAGASEGLRSFRVTGHLDSEPPSARVTGDPLAGMDALGQLVAGGGWNQPGQPARMAVQHCWSRFQRGIQGVAGRSTLLWQTPNGLGCSGAEHGLTEHHSARRGGDLSPLPCPQSASWGRSLRCLGWQLLPGNYDVQPIPCALQASRVWQLSALRHSRAPTPHLPPSGHTSQAWSVRRSAPE